MATSDLPPSLPSSSALPKIRISSGSRFAGSPTPESPGFDRAQAVREGSLARSGSNASTRSAMSNTYQGGRTPTRAAPRTRSPSRPRSSHAGGILPPASFFRIGQTRGTLPRPQGSGPSASIPYGPTKPTAAGPLVQKQMQSRPPTVIPASPPPRATAVAGSSREGNREKIALTSISYRSRPGTMESSFGGVIDETDATAADTSLAYSTPHQSYRSKASRDPLLPPMKPASGSLRSATESSPHAGLAGVFARRSIESSRMSSDLEQGVREAALESHRNFPPASTILNADFTRPSSLDNSDDRAHTYQTIGGPSSGDLHQSKLSQIDRAGPKATIHPHPVIIPASPILDPKTGKPVRNYQLIPSKSIFFFRGKALTGGDTPLPFIATLTLVLGLAGAWFACTAPWWWHNISVAVPIVAGYMTLFCLASLLMTAFRDPGILPRNLDLNPPMASLDDESPPAPLPRDLRVRGGVVRTKYCSTCKLYRPPRASHCRLCDNCVDSCDHHCQWVNNCVGRRNYTHFFTFLIAVSITDIFIIITTALHVYFVSHWDHLSFHDTLSRTAGSVVGFLISSLTIWPVLTLLGYHCRLIILNITTIEQDGGQGMFLTPFAVLLDIPGFNQMRSRWRTAGL